MLQKLIVDKSMKHTVHQLGKVHRTVRLGIIKINCHFTWPEIISQPERVFCCGKIYRHWINEKPC